MGFTQESRTGSISEAEAKAAMPLFGQRINANTGNYDLKYHRLRLNVDPAQSFISGEITSYFVAKENLNTITFDLANNMNVSNVTQRGASIPFTRNGNEELVVTLPQSQNQGVLDSLTVSYSGDPVSSGFGSFESTTHNGDPIMWTLSEPFGAKAWWPCKQDLNDKIDKIDVYITTPRYNNQNEEYMAVSNGLEIGQTVQGNSKTTHYKHQYAIPAYLIAFAVTNYSVYSHQVANNGNPFNIVNYVYPEDLQYAQSNTPVTVNIMNFYTNLVGEYPFADEKYGHAQFGWGGGMEHTTVSFMNNFNRGLIAHELGHQWFGDKVTCGSWQDIWLNEGFATYMSGMVIENFDGNNAFKSWKQNQTSSITSRTYGSVYVPSQDTTSVGRIFSSRLTYNKGSMVLHMLRKKVGDANFFQGLKNYLNNPQLAYGYAKTADFRAEMEAISGQDLMEFFNDWIYGEGYPTFRIGYNQTDGENVTLNISQIQSDPSVSYFETDLPIRFLGTQGQTKDIVLSNNVNDQDFYENVGFQVQQIIIDPENDIVTGYNDVILANSDFNFENALQVYPNPAENKIFIDKPSEVEIYSVSIFNLLGQHLYKKDYSSEGSEGIDISNFSNGLLFVEIKSTSGLIVKKVIKR